MASISKFLLALLFSYHTLIAHAADDRRHKVLSVGSLMKSSTACSEPKGAVVSMNSPAIPLGYSIFVSVVITSNVWTGCFSDSTIHRRHGAVAPPVRHMLACTLQEGAHLGGAAPARPASSRLHQTEVLWSRRHRAIANRTPQPCRPRWAPP